jgi:enamine deaminase RidA (YjgF/YER057c/UK114 family)
MLQRFDVGTRMSEMAVYKSTVYLAGQVADDATQDITPRATVQARLAKPLWKIEMVVTAAITS